MHPKQSQQRMTRVPRKDSQEVKAGRASLDKLCYLHECGSKPEHVPLHLKQGTPLADCCWPRDIWKISRKEGVFLLNVLDRGCLTSERLGIPAKGLCGVQRAWDEHSIPVYREHLLFTITYCLPEDQLGKSPWSRQVWKGGALPDTNAVGLIPCLQCSLQKPRLLCGIVCSFSHPTHFPDQLLTGMGPSRECLLSFIHW